MGIKASCTWGEGSDIMVVIDPDSDTKSSRFNKRFVLHEHPITRAEVDVNGVANKGLYVYGSVEKGSFGLTAQEALDLAADLIQAGKDAMELNEKLTAYMKEAKS